MVHVASRRFLPRAVQIRSMDSRTHRRFLEYVEKHPYFGGPRLSRDEWPERDRELATLMEKRGRDALATDERDRLRALRRLLLVD